MHIHIESLDSKACKSYPPMHFVHEWDMYRIIIGRPRECHNKITQPLLSTKRERKPA